MPTKDLVTRVWIEPGCIVCDACENAAPTVFEVTEDSCIIRPAALNAEFTKPQTQSIIEAAEECPVDVIKFETAPIEVTAEQAAAMDAASAAKTQAAEVSQPSARATAQEVKTAAADSRVSAVPNPTSAPVKPAPPKSVPALTREPAIATANKSSSEKLPPVLDPAIAALLKAALSRGGAATIRQREGSIAPEMVTPGLREPRNLPPDARQALRIEALKRVKQQEGMGRRAFLGSTALSIGWIAFGVGAGVAVGPAFGRFMMPNVLEEPDSVVRVGSLNKYLTMEPGAVNEDYKPKGIWMIREDNRIAALSDICTHLGCIPNWLPNERIFKCPCHGSGYYFNGINFEGPTPRPLERFKLTVEDGIVVVDKSVKFRWELGQWDSPGAFITV